MTADDTALAALNSSSSFSSPLSPESIGSHYARYGQQSPTECWKLKIISVYCVFLLIFSLIFNTLLLLIFYIHKELRSSHNLLIISLTILNLIGSSVELPLVITTNFKCRWVWGETGCYISGVVMYSVGAISVYLITAISAERFYIIYKPLSIKSINNNVILIIVLICCLSGIFWAILPLFGWSYYSLEGSLTSCSVEWYERSFNVISYNMAIFVFMFFIPLIVIIITNIKLILIIKKMPNMTKEQSDPKAKKRMQMERNLTIITVSLVVGFLISWFPYAYVSIYSSFISVDLPPLAGTVPAMFAKSSMVWTSMLYIFSNKQIRVKISKGIFTREIEEVSMSRNKTLHTRAEQSGTSTDTNRV